MRMLNKRVISAFLALLLTIFTGSAVFALPVFAAENPPRLVDEADLLSDSEESELSGMLDEISERQQVDIVVVTVDSMGGASAMAFADDFYDEEGYGFGDEQDGILLLVSMGERDWYISTAGYGITAVTDAGREYISGIFVEDLSAGSYMEAFTGFAKLCDDFITQAKTGEPYDVDNMPQEPFGVFDIVLAFGIAFIIALIVTGIMRWQLKTVYSQSAADNYIKQDSMQLTKKDDLLLYKHVERKKRPEKTSSDSPSSSGRSNSTGGSRTHTSSSGKKHGGGGGKF